MCFTLFYISLQLNFLLPLVVALRFGTRLETTRRVAVKQALCDTVLNINVKTKINLKGNIEIGTISS